ncbi:MAG: helix-turn-helix domain-containing protein [Aggregatilineales bacterium]
MLSHRLRQIRETKGYSQRELGRLCNLGANQINRYENGTSDPTIHTLKAIADQLEVSTDFLLGLTDDPHVQVREPALNADERTMLEVYRREGWTGVIRLGAEKLSK